MRPNKIETAVQCSVCRMWMFAGFSGHDNIINIYIYVCVCIFHGFMPSLYYNDGRIIKARNQWSQIIIHAIKYI